MPNGRNGQITYNVSFTADQASLKALQQSLEKIKKIPMESANSGQDWLDLVKAKQTASELQAILKSSTNVKLGTINVESLTKNLKNATIPLAEMQKRLEAIGPLGKQAFNQLAVQSMVSTKALKEQNKVITELANSFKQSFKYTAMAGISNTILNTLSGAVTYAKQLDTSLNNIRIVTGKSAEEMTEFAIQANRAAQQLGRTTTDYTDAALIYYQQGLGEQAANSLAETTLKIANITQQTTTAVSEQVTALINGFKIEADGAEQAFDKLAAVAAASASDLAEISGAISKVASTANMVGVSLDSLTAQVATIISVTRQAPESVGTALRTIYARMMDLKTGTDEEGVSLGDVSSKMAAMGVQIVDETGNLRQMDDVLGDVANKWQYWSDAQRMAAAQAMGGKRQYNNLVALFDNWGKYIDYNTIALKSLGTVEQQQGIYMDSLAAKQEQLAASSERLKRAFINEQNIKFAVNNLKVFVDLFSNLVEGIGGGSNLLLMALGPITKILGQTFSAQIVAGVQSFGSAFKTTFQNIKNLGLPGIVTSLKDFLFTTQSITEKIDSAKASIIAQFQPSISNTELNEIATGYTKILEAGRMVTEQERQHYEALMKSRIELQGQYDAITQNTEQIQQTLNQFADMSLVPEVNLKQHLGDFSQVERTLKQLKDETVPELTEQIDIFLNNTDVAGAKLANTIKQLQTSGNNFKQWGFGDENIFNTFVTENDGLQELLNTLGQTEPLIQNIVDKVKTGTALNEEEIQQFLIAYKQFLSQFDKSTEESLTRIHNQVDGTIKGLIQNLQTTKKSQQQIENGIEKRKVAAGYTNLLSATTQLTAGFRALYNVPKIWDNENLSQSEKLLQTITSLTSGVGMVGNSLRSISTGVNSIAGTGGPLAALTVGLTALLTAITLFVGNRWGHSFFKVKENFEELNKTISQSREKVQQLNQSLKLLYEKNEFGESLEQEFHHLAQGVNEYGDNISLTSDEYARYEQIVETLIKESPDLISGYTAEGQAIVNNTDLINRYKQGLNEARLEAINMGVDTIQTLKEMQDSLERLNNALKGTSLRDLNDVQHDLNIDLDTDRGKALAEMAIAEYEKQEQEANQAIVEFQLYSDKILTQKLNASQYTQAITSKVLNMDGINSEDITEAFLQQRKAYAEQLVELTNKLSPENEKWIQEIIEISKGGYDAVNDAVVKALSERNMFSGKELQAFEITTGLKVVNYDPNDPTMLKVVDQSLINLQKAFSERMKTLKIDSDDSNLILNQLAQLPKELRNVDIFDELFSDESIDSAKEISHAIRDIENNYRYLQDEVQADQDFANIDSALEKLSKTTKLTKEEQKELNSSLSSLTQRFPEFANALEHASQDTERYKEVLLALREQIAQERIEASQRQVNDDVVEIGIQINDDDYNKAMEKIAELADSEYELDIKIKADSDATWSNVIKDIRDIDQAAQVIGEDFVVASDKLRDLNNTFPGILEGIKYLADGTAQLDKQAVDSAIKNAQLEAQIDAEKTAEKLKHTQQELLTKAKHAQTMANIASKMAEKEVITDKEGKKALAEMQKTAEEFTRKTSKETAENEIDNISAVTDAGDENYSQGAKNASSMWESAALNAREYADYAIQAIGEVTSALADPNKKSLGLAFPEITDHYKGQGGSTSAKASTAATAVEEASFDVTDSASWHQMAEEWQAIADEYTTAANDITGQLAELASGATSLNKTRENIKAGLGAKGASKAANHSTIDYLHDEIDIYTKVNREIEHYNDLLTLLQRQEKKLVGHGLEDNYTQQIKVLQQLENAQKRKLALAKQDLQVQRANLQTLGVTIEADGQIANYADILLNKQKAINALIAQYNAMTGVQQQNEGKLLKDRIEAEKTAYNNLKNQMEAYNKVYDSLNDIANEIDDIVDKQLELQIKRFNVMIDVHLDLAAAEKEWNAFRKKCQLRLGDNNFLGDAKAELHNFYILFQQGGDGIVNQVKDHVSQIMNEINVMKNGGYSSIYGDNMKQALEDLKKYNGELMDYLELYEDTLKQVWDDYLSQIDKTSKAFDTRIKQYEHIQKLIDHDINLINKIFTGPDMEKALIGQYTLSYHNALEQISAAREEKEYYEHLLQEALRQRDKYEFGTTEWQSANEAYEKYRDLWESATDALNDSLEKSIDAAAERFAQAMKNAWNNLDRQLFNGWDLATVSDDWTRGKQRSEMFLDDSAERDLNMQKLRADWNKLLNNYKAGSKAQKELSEYMDKQVEALENQRVLTKEDIELARLRIQLKEQEIALEDAQDNKTKLRLRRDSQGNYTYQYTADENNVLEQEAQLSATRLELYEKEREAQQQALDRMLEARQAYSEAIQAIMDDDALTDEQKQQKIAEVTEYYAQLMTDIAENYSDLQKGFKQDLADFFADVDQTQIYPEFETTLGDMMNRFAYDPDSLQNVIMEAYEEVSRANEEYAQAVEEACNRAGVNIEDLMDIKNRDIITTRDQIITEQDLIAKYVDEEQQLRYVINELDNMRNAYEGVRASALEVADAAHRMFEEVSLAANAWRDYANAAQQAGIIAMQAQAQAPQVEMPSAPSTPSSTPRTAPLVLSSPFGVNPGRNDADNKFTGAYYRITYKADDGKRKTIRNDLTYDQAQEALAELNRMGAAGRDYKVQHYDTGGYTGDWVNGDSVGKLAVLHQKELVLDKTDTENVLAAVDIAKVAINAITSHLGQFNTGAINSVSNSNTEQQITINADFPNVSSATEIQEAFKQMANLAEQRAHRTRN